MRLGAAHSLSPVTSPRLRFRAALDGRAIALPDGGPGFASRLSEKRAGVAWALCLAPESPVLSLGRQFWSFRHKILKSYWSLRRNEREF